MSEYPLFMPPNELAEKGAKNWNKKEAQAYFDWFLSVRYERVKFLLQYINNYTNFENNLKLITEVNRKVFYLIQNEHFHTIREFDGGMKLNNQGLAVVVDFGLLVAQFLEEKNPSLFWKIAKGPKSYHSYNLPVLDGFSNGEYDLVFISINKFGYALNHQKSPYDWNTFIKELQTRIL